MIKKMKLELENEHPRDQFIIFDEGPHTYTLNGEIVNISVTTLIKKYWEQFNAKLISGRIVKSNKMRDPSYTYYGMTQQEIMNKWNSNTAAQLGTDMHRKIELYYNNALLPEEYPDTLEFKHFLKFHHDFTQINAEFKPYRTEWIIYDDSGTIAGSIDMLYRDSNGNIIIVDWKRTTKEKLYKHFGNKKGLDLLKHLDDTNYNHYAIQVNIYRHMLETYYLNVDEKIIGMYLCILHPDEENYIFEYVPRIEQEVKDIFNKLL